MVECTLMHITCWLINTDYKLFVNRLKMMHIFEADNRGLCKIFREYFSNTQSRCGIDSICSAGRLCYSLSVSVCVEVLFQ